MILILTRPNDDSTDDVCKWLEYYDATYVKINNYKSLLEFINITGDLFESLSLTTAVWLRKYPHLDPNFFSSYSGVEKNQLRTEVDLIYQHIANSGSKVLKGSIKNANKLNILKEASLVGLKVPETKICTKKESLIKFINNNGKIITKPIGEPAFIRQKDKIFGQHTKLITKDNLITLSEEFFPSLFQEYISPEYELRIFFLNPDFYAISIKQENVDLDNNIVDQRYYYGSNFKVVQYRLPKLVKQKLRKLVERLDIETCSVDMIVDNSNNHYFLEINPSGQFKFFSEHCNLYLEKKIAKYLIDLKYEK